MLICSAEDDVVGAFLAVRPEQEERGVCFFSHFLELFSGFEGVHVVLSGEEGGAGASERALREARCTRSLKRVTTSLLVLLPLRKSVFFAPSTSLGYFLRYLRTALMDFGFSIIYFNNAKLVPTYRLQKMISVAD